MRQLWNRTTLVVAMLSMLNILVIIVNFVALEVAVTDAIKKLGGPVELEVFRVPIKFFFAVSMLCLLITVCVCFRQFWSQSTSFQLLSNKGLWVVSSTLVLCLVLDICWLERKRKWVNRLADAHNLETIGIACINFTNYHGGGRYPDDLAELGEAEMGFGRVFVSPNSPRERFPSNARELRAGVCDYVYVPPAKKLPELKNPHEVIVAFSKRPIHGWTNVLFADGHVEYRTDNGAVAPPKDSSTARESRSGTKKEQESP